MNAARNAASPAAAPVVHLAPGTALVPEEILGTHRDGSRGMFRELAALVLDRHLRRLVRIRQPVDLRIGRLLVRMEACSGSLALGFARLSDYTTERLGLPARRVQTLLALARRLADLPRLAAAFEAGVVSLSQVRVLLRVATAANEAAWTERAGATTVRRLEIEVRAALSGERGPGATATVDDAVPSGTGAAGRDAAGDGAVNGDAADGDVANDDAAAIAVDGAGIDDDPAAAGEFIAFAAPAAMRGRWEQALEIARRSAGAGDPVWRSVEFLVADYLAGVPELAALLARISAAPGAGEQGIGGPADDEQHGGGAGVDGAAAVGSAATRGAGAPPCPGDASGGAGIELFEEVLAGLATDPASGHDSIPTDCPVVVFPGSVQEGPDDTAVDLDARLCELVRMRQNVSWNLGRLLRLFADRRLHRELGFMSFARYCRERLGIGGRRAWLLIALERRLVSLPGITGAYRSGALSWVKAAALTRIATETSEDRWLRLAEAVTVRRLLEEVALVEADRGSPCPRGLDEDGRVQLSTPTRSPAAGGPGDRTAATEGTGATRASEIGPRTRICFWAPHEVASLWHEALAICRHRAGRPLDDWECVESILASFLETWGVRADAAWRRRYRIFERDGWRCRVPGCTSRGNLQVHHVEFRSRGGGDDDANLAVLCATHHLQGIHRNRVRCHALPDGLFAWEFGPDSATGPLVAYVEDVLWPAARAAVAPAAESETGTRAG